ncbi:MAG: DNA-directed RNA polymerase [Candidatus Bathyarchaeota archaeon]|nr:DNA-directed RNA polymerase [Candidatus Bathyarchaeota archaeon]
MLLGGASCMSDREPREMHSAVCSDCGNECQVPFKPDPSRPVYCRDCWSKRRRASSFRY